MALEVTGAASPATGTPAAGGETAGAPAAAAQQGESDSTGAHNPGQAGSTPAPVTTAPAAAEPIKPDAVIPPPAKPRTDLTARLAALSTENRKATQATRAAEARAKAAEAKAADLDALLAKAKDDPSVIPQLFEKAGLSFEKVVNFYAEQGEGRDLTPDEARAKEIADLKAKVDKQDADRETERKTAAARAEANARTETIAGIADTIKKGADKFEICARLGDEAAADVFEEVVKTWNTAGRPELMPGEFDEAVAAAIELKELEYEERGKKLQKAARTAAQAAAAPAAGAAATNSNLPASLTAGAPLSDKDADIVKGLIDKTAPAFGSQRAKPQTINSSLGGSAPPRAPARGSMDPRDALREVLAPFQRQP